MIYLYAITEAGADAPAVGGLNQQPLKLHSVAGVTALYSTHDELEPRPDPDTMWRHDRVVEATMRSGPTLPVRFGTTFPDVGALGVALEPEAPRLARRLKGVRGCVELAVRVGLPPAPARVPRDGREYVALKLSDRREREAAAEQTLVPLAELAVRAHRPVGDVEMLKASYLVREHEVQRFAHAVRALQDRHRELSLSCTGPWPPYSFTEDEPA